MRQADAESRARTATCRPPRRIIETSSDANARTATIPTESPLRIAVFEPDIPQNLGALLRLGACLDVPVDVIEPCGFVLDDRRMRRAGMDYLARAALRRHRCWEDFLADLRTSSRRLVLLTTRGGTRHAEFGFDSRDTLLLGRESAGVPEAVHAAADERVRIPMAAGARSLNVALAAAMVLGEALRQTGTLPKDR